MRGTLFARNSKNRTEKALKFQALRIAKAVYPRPPKKGVRAKAFETLIEWKQRPATHIASQIKERDTRALLKYAQSNKINFPNDAVREETGSSTGTQRASNELKTQLGLVRLALRNRKVHDSKVRPPRRIQGLISMILAGGFDNEGTMWYWLNSNIEARGLVYDKYLSKATRKWHEVHPNIVRTLRIIDSRTTVNYNSKLR
jgi:hypothetical protein